METKTMDLSQLKIERKDDGPRPGPRNGRRKTGWIAITVVLIIASVVTYRFLASPPVTVEVTTVSSINPDQATAILNATGYAVAQRRAAVASKGTGRLVELNVREGDRVKKGDVIGRLESADMAAARARRPIGTWPRRRWIRPRPRRPRRLFPTNEKKASLHPA